MNRWKWYILATIYFLIIGSLIGTILWAIIKIVLHYT